MTTQEQVKDVVSQVLADKADKGGIKRVVWIGAGGSNGGNLSCPVLYGARGHAGRELQLHQQ